MSEEIADTPDADLSDFAKTAKDLFAGACGGIAQVLIGMCISTIIFLHTTSVICFCMTRTCEVLFQKDLAKHCNESEYRIHADY